MIITLIVLLLLSIVAVAFLSNAQLEYTTARAFSNKARAEAAAQAGVDVAIANLRETLKNYPDSSTVWETVSTDKTSGMSNTTPATSLYFHAAYSGSLADPKPIPGEKNVPGGAPSQTTFVLPLVSGATPKGLKTRFEALPKLNVAETNSRKQNFIDLNFRENPEDIQGWIGSPATPTVPPGSTTPKPQSIKVPWVNVYDGSGELRDENDNPRIISRYAYWIEDESFRCNANVLGSAKRARLTDGKAFNEIPLQGILPSSIDRDAFASSAVTMRDLFLNKRFLDRRAFNRVSGTYAMGDKLKYLFTLNSASHEVSRSGARRLNLNDLVVSGSPANSQASILTQLKKMTAAIESQSPHFGQRFYRTTPGASSLNSDTVVPADREKIYLTKIAANIRDYIDDDSQPTIVTGGAVAAYEKPFRAMNFNRRSDINPTAAIGKEAVPYIHEVVMRVKAHRLPVAGDRRFKISIEYYIELWNMTNKDILLSTLAKGVPGVKSGGSVFLKITNQPAWYGGNGYPIREDAARDITIELKPTPEFDRFRAGRATVITTDGDRTQIPGLLLNPGEIVPIPESDITSDGRKYEGETNWLVSNFPTLLIYTRDGDFAGGRFKLDGKDYKTELSWGNNCGFFDSQMAALVIENNNCLVDNYRAGRIGNTPKDTIASFFFRGSAMLGTRPDPVNGLSGGRLAMGDPRTNNEPLVYAADAPSMPATRFFTTNNRTSDDRDKGVPVVGTLTRPNYTLINGTQWGDQVRVDPASPTLPYTVDPVTKASVNCAPSVIRDGPLTSIGQLGDIFDPVREGNASTIQYSLGGGRSLAIGQPESTAIWDGSSSSASRNWCAWRLADIFSAAPKDDLTTPDRNENFEIEGRINLNGINRDDGAALRALLYGIEFQDDGDPLVKGKAVVGDNKLFGVERVIARLKDRLAKTESNGDPKGPLWERGEISELEGLFNSATPELVSGVKMADANDRSREELVRRIMELTTTRGSVFSVYVVGQSVVPQRSTTPLAEGEEPSVVVNSTFARKVTFMLVPVYDPTLPTDPLDFDPNNQQSINKRFAQPIRYDVKILAAEARP